VRLRQQRLLDRRRIDNRRCIAGAGRDERRRHELTEQSGGLRSIHGQVAARKLDDDVAARSTIENVLARTANQHVVALTAEQSVIARSAEDEARGRGRQPTVAVDMSDVSFIDSSGLRVLIAGYKAANGAGGALTVQAPSDPVTRLLEITGQLERFVPAK